LNTSEEVETVKEADKESKLIETVGEIENIRNREEFEKSGILDVYSVESMESLTADSVDNSMDSKAEVSKMDQDNINRNNEEAVENPKDTAVEELVFPAMESSETIVESATVRSDVDVVEQAEEMLDGKSDVNSAVTFNGKEADNFEAATHEATEEDKSEETKNLISDDSVADTKSDRDEFPAVEKPEDSPTNKSVDFSTDISVNIVTDKNIDTATDESGNDKSAADEDTGNTTKSTATEALADEKPKETALDDSLDMVVDITVVAKTEVFSDDKSKDTAIDDILDTAPIKFEDNTAETSEAIAAIKTEDIAVERHTVTFQNTQEATLSEIMTEIENVEVSDKTSVVTSEISKEIGSEKDDDNVSFKLEETSSEKVEELVVEKSVRFEDTTLKEKENTDVIKSEDTKAEKIEKTVTEKSEDTAIHKRSVLSQEIVTEKSNVLSEDTTAEEFDAVAEKSDVAAEKSNVVAVNSDIEEEKSDVVAKISEDGEAKSNDNVEKILEDTAVVISDDKYLEKRSLLTHSEVTIEITEPEKEDPELADQSLYDENEIEAVTDEDYDRHTKHDTGSKIPKNMVTEIASEETFDSNQTSPTSEHKKDDKDEYLVNEEVNKISSENIPAGEGSPVKEEKDNISSEEKSNLAQDSMSKENEVEKEERIFQNTKKKTMVEEEMKEDNFEVKGNNNKESDHDSNFNSKENDLHLISEEETANEILKTTDTSEIASNIEEIDKVLELENSEFGKESEEDKKECILTEDMKDIDLGNNSDFAKETVKEVIKAVGLNETIFGSTFTFNQEESTDEGPVLSSNSVEKKSEEISTDVPAEEKDNEATDSVQNSQIDSDEEGLLPRRKSCLVNGKNQEESPEEQNIIGKDLKFQKINFLITSFLR